MSLLDRVASIVGDKSVTDDIFERYIYAKDCTVESAMPIIPDMVVRPSSTSEVAELVRLCNKENVPIFMKGGGASLSGNVPNAPGCITFDMTGMNEVLEIGEDGNYVITQTGINWAKLHAELYKVDRYPCFRGPISGLSATVGGSISNASLGYNTAMAYAGELANVVLGLKVVLPTGAVIWTGSLANPYAKEPSHRYGGGPDMTGLFIGDQGVFGVKTEAVLATRPIPPYHDGLAYAFNKLEDADEAAIRIVRLGTCCDLVGMDGQLIRTAASFGGAIDRVMGAENPMITMLKGMLEDLPDETLKFLKKEVESLIFCTVEGWSEKEIEAKLEVVKDIFEKVGGVSVPSDFANYYYENGLFTLVEGATAGTPYLSVACARLPLRSNAPFTRQYNEVMKKYGKKGVMGLPTVCAYFTHFHIGIPIEMTLDPLNPEGVKGLRDAWIEHRDTLIKEFGGRQYWIGQFFGRQLVKVYTGEYVESLRKLKDAWDPNHILQPGYFPYSVGDEVPELIPKRFEPILSQKEVVK